MISLISCSYRESRITFYFIILSGLFIICLEFSTKTTFKTMLQRTDFRCTHQSRHHPRRLFIKKTLKGRLEDDNLVYHRTILWLHSWLHFKQVVLQLGRTCIPVIPLSSGFGERLHRGVCWYFPADYVHLHHVERRDVFRAQRGLDTPARRSRLLLLHHVSNQICRFSTHFHFVNPAVLFSLQFQGMIFVDGINPNTLLACLYVGCAQLLGGWLSQFLFHRFYLRQAKFWKDQFR